MVTKAETQSEAEVKERTCGNCAAMWRPPAENKDANFYCRRLPAQAQMVRVDVPRVLRGVPQMKDGKPVMEPSQQLALLYPPTVEHSVCYDGWRPLGTLPGDRDSAKFPPIFDELIKMLAPMLSPPKLDDFPKDPPTQCAYKNEAGEQCVLSEHADDLDHIF